MCGPIPTELSPRTSSGMEAKVPSWLKRVLFRAGYRDKVSFGVSASSRQTSKRATRHRWFPHRSHVLEEACPILCRHWVYICRWPNGRPSAVTGWTGRDRSPPWPATQSGHTTSAPVPSFTRHSVSG